MRKKKVCPTQVGISRFFFGAKTTRGNDEADPSSCGVEDETIRGRNMLETELGGLKAGEKILEN